MERKLASIRTIDALFPIEGADQIVRARVMGWDVVIRTFRLGLRPTAAPQSTLLLA